MKALLDTLAAGLQRAGSVPAFLRALEAEKGYRVLSVGDVPWLSVDEWSPDCVVSQDQDRIRLVLIVALTPGGGAFRRLLAQVQADGKVPVVIAPTRELQSTLSRWGWRHRLVGDSFETREDQWSPAA